MKRGTVVGLVVGVAVIVTIVAGVWWFLGRSPGPDDAARSYLVALESGDYAAIEALRVTPTDDPLVEQAFATASSRVTDARLVDVGDAHGGEVDVRAEVNLGGETRELAFTMQQVDGRWTLTGDDLVTLHASVALDGAPIGDSVRIGDALAPANTEVALLAAVYDVTAGPRGILSGTDSAAVMPGDPVEVEVEATLSPDATALAQEQLNAYLDQCTQPAAAVPTNCGIRVPWAADLTSLESIAFRVDERPALVLTADATGFDATGGVIVATATGASRAGGPGSFTYRADDWSVRGSVRFEGDQMVLAVR